MEHKLVLKIQETEKERDRLVEDKMSVLEVNIVWLIETIVLKRFPEPEVNIVKLIQMVE